MQGAVDALLQEAASVFRLVEFIERFCVEQQSNRSYVPATSQFLQTVRRLADGTKRHLQQTAGEAGVRLAKSSRLDSWLTNERSVLHTIKGSWTIIHKYLKPAADAHALQVPFPLVKLAERQLRSVQSMSGAMIAVLLTPELNYFQRSHTSLKQTIDSLTNITGQPDVPRDLIGFVELPFSQGPSLFSNILLYHELGHFVLAENSSAKNILKQAATSALREVYGVQFTSLAKPDRAGAERMLQNWAEEIFCDLLAIRLIGPAFVFASIEMFGLLGLLADDKQARFLPTHPAPACRFNRQLKMLHDDGWWDTVSTLKSDHRVQLERLAKISDPEYWLSYDGQKLTDRRFLDAFSKMLSTVDSLVKQITAPPLDSRECFHNEHTDMEDCLAEGIVPSRLYSGRHLSLSLPVATINAAFCFYLTDKLSNLITKLADQDAANLEHRAYWTRRLESMHPMNPSGG